MSDQFNHPEIKRFADAIQTARQEKTQINIQGGNTKSWYGDKPKGERLSTTNYTGVLDYQPEELVITVRAGTSLAEVESLLASKKQYFPFEPPHFGTNVTIGGMVAAGLAGPGRAQAGNLRDYVLGADIMDGTAKTLAFGGKVMKNVAGYDVSRLLPGSLGTLALLLNVSIKVLPKPIASKTLKFELSQATAILQMNTWASQPLPISASTWLGDVGSGELVIRLAGAQAAVAAAHQKMSREISCQELDEQEASQFWTSLREQSHQFFNLDNGQSLIRFAINPMSGPLNLPGTTCIEWLGGQRWIKSSMPFAEAKSLAIKHGGHATLFRGDKSTEESVFTSLRDNPLTAPLELVQQRLRAAFDPDSVFQTLRMPL